MKDTPFYIFDLETNGLLHELDVVWCLSYQKYVNGKIVERRSLTDYKRMKLFFEQDGYFVAHNGIRFDFVVVLRELGVEVENIIDTLGLSWYLFPLRKTHNLEDWGVHFGVEKPKIKAEEWRGPLEGETKEQFIKKIVNRCQEDTEIGLKVFKHFMSYLEDIYGDFESMLRIIGYINFKMDCLREQEEAGIKLNSDLCEEHINSVSALFDEKTKLLSEIMPPELGTVLKTKPKKPFKADGTLSVYGDNWYNYLRENNLPFSTEVVREDPNPGSPPQIQKWLDILGWEPITFKVSKATGKRLPQVSLPFGQGICPSVKELYEDNPNLVELENYYMLRHRKGLFNSYLKGEYDGKVTSTAHGFTNTLRLTHSKPIANLPKPGNPWGKEVRECLTVPDDSYVMLGSDVSSLEDNTKQHYIYFYDPEYVNDMRVPGFDPHLDIGVLAGLITKEEEEFFKRIDNMSEAERLSLSPDDIVRFKAIGKKRSVAKSTNFAATYGAGGPKIAEVAKLPLPEGYRLHKVYWTRNAAVKKIADACTVKSVSGQKWLYNPISGFWLFLKADKDRFSTLNQNSGVYIFDSWLRKVREALQELKIPVVMQYHDELLIVCKSQYKDYVRNILYKAMEQTNDEVKLNVKIGISVDVGQNYAECH